MRKTRIAQPIETTEPVTTGALLVCPACEMNYRAGAEHICEPERVWRRLVSRWNDLPAAEQRASLAECRESGHTLIDIPLAGTRMCARCCVYVENEGK